MKLARLAREQIQSRHLELQPSVRRGWRAGCTSTEVCSRILALVALEPDKDSRNRIIRHASRAPVLEA